MVIATALLVLLLVKCELWTSSQFTPTVQTSWQIRQGTSITLPLTAYVPPGENLSGVTLRDSGDTFVVEVSFPAPDSLRLEAKVEGTTRLLLELQTENATYPLTIDVQVYAPFNFQLYRLEVDTLYLSTTLPPDAAEPDSVIMDSSLIGSLELLSWHRDVLVLKPLRLGTFQGWFYFYFPQGEKRQVVLELEVRERRLVLGEVFTNAGCIPCAPAGFYLDSLAEVEPHLALIRYHTNWPDPNDPMYLVNTRDSYQRIMYYQIVQTPSLLVDGNLQSGEYDPGWGHAVSSESQIGADFYLDHGGWELMGVDSLRAELCIKRSPEVTWPDDFTIRAVVTEDSVEYDGGNGETIHHQVMRDLEERSYASVTADSLVTEFHLEFNSSAPRTRFHVVAFLQRESDRQVLQTFRLAFRP